MLPPPSQSANVIGWRVVHPPPAPPAAPRAATATREEAAAAAPSASVVVTTAVASSPLKTSPTQQPLLQKQHSAVGRAAAAVLHRLSPLRRAGASSLERGEKN
jgi:hypothetical protein